MFIYHLFKNIVYNATITVCVSILMLGVYSIKIAFTSFLIFLCVLCLLDGIIGYYKERRKSPTKN